MMRIERQLPALLLGLTLLICPISGALASETLDRIVAVVNDDVVLLSELRGEMARLAADVQRANVALPSRSVLQRQALERLILLKLQLATAESLGLSVDEETLAQAVGNIARSNNLTIGELRDALEKDGLSFEEFRENLRRQILISRLRNREVVSRIQVTKAEIDSYLARGGDQPGGRTDFHLLHILIATPDGASPQQIESASRRAEQVLADLRAGADFRTLAQSVSDGRQAAQGGDLGWLKANQVPSLFAEAVVTLPRGGLAGPLRSASGFHIVQLEDYKGTDRAIVAQTKARHILLRTDELTSDEDAQTRLTQLRQRILDGDDFATLARSHSDDKASAIKGGELGWLSPGDTVPRFEEEMNALPPGEISRPFKTDFGWHIVQVEERRQHDATDEVLRNKAREAIRERKAEEAMELYLRRLRDEAYVELRLEDIAE
jgi:peptidyl-prolyl cis-trans isomerase SurA